MRETCGCGYSLARRGVGYWCESGWLCKRCGELHTREPLAPGQVGKDPRGTQVPLIAA